MSVEEFAATERLMAVSTWVFLLDVFTKMIVVSKLSFGEQRVIFDGFFKFVHWGNTGAAWSMFTGSNGILSGVAILAMFGLYCARKQFGFDTLAGQISLGMIFGGIAGNLLDRLRYGHVVDFIRFHWYQRGGGEMGFPAFNIADTGICVGVGLMFLLAILKEADPKADPYRGVNTAKVPENKNR
jgi:signal peptidase II